MVKEEKYLNLEAQYRESHFQRLNAAREETVETDAIHTELLEMMKQINLHTGEIAKIIYDLGSNEENEGNVE
jgi:Na+/phosphate symporter